MGDDRFRKVNEQKREIAEWRDGPGLYVIAGIAAILLISFLFRL
jgi:hypothetical protein